MSEIGDLLAGRYRLRRRLGSGAMGVVWKAIDQRLQRPVAVKQLLQQPGLTPERAEEARQRAMREGRIAARLHHANAIAVHDVDEHDGLPLLVMEYFPARSLAEILVEDGLLTPMDTATVGAQVAAALAEAHDAGIVHRDVKPGNILISSDSVVKIGDFGISHATGDVSVTQSGVVAGTPAYFAPEIARGRPPAPSSDVFSLGATLYAALEGVPPFGEDEDNSLAVLHRVAAGEVAPPQHAGPLTELLLAMLAPDPAQRPTARQAERALRAVAGGEPALVAAGALAEAETEPAAGVGAQTVPVRPLPDASGTRLDVRPVPDVPAAVSAPTGTATPPPHRRWGWLAMGIVLLLAAVGGIIAATSSGGDNAAPPLTSTPNSTRPVTPADLRSVVSDYYALLPERPGRAWEHLGPGLRAQGREAFTRYWRTVASVTVVSAPRNTGDRTVQIGVELVMKDGARVTETHQLGLVDADGRPLIDSDTVLHRERTEPAPPPPPPGSDEKADEPKDRKDDGQGDDEGPGRGDDEGKGNGDNKDEKGNKGKGN
ncbi:serine/threonine-protein kinase [Prauserella muralis]|uniref:non-specific serine/threonine protein kinase n=1 Tax=Prauserella muralis TaxID=588067 RepID=A0A2V4B0K1_9PSEU|nr:serine/threonine-protein kinase [Prauserella muralis]PXY27724.1 hypothetical protein BAY60_15160 [Prauserella muralis]TWE22530.1 hypothetical protein FHX69_3772 [Prauserella muralis]